MHTRKKNYTHKQKNYGHKRTRSDTHTHQNYAHHDYRVRANYFKTQSAIHILDVRMLEVLIPLEVLTQMDQKLSGGRSSQLGFGNKFVSLLSIAKQSASRFALWKLLLQQGWKIKSKSIAPCRGCWLINFLPGLCNSQMRESDFKMSSFSNVFCLCKWLSL